MRAGAALFAAALLIAAPARAADYVQAPGSSLTFAGTYQGEEFTGRFPGFAARLSFDPARPATFRLDVAVPLTLATTGNADYDGEMRGRAFFDAAEFPLARYTATRIRALGGNRYAADGALNLRGVTRPVTLTFNWSPGAEPVLAGQAVVRRLDFGVGGGDWADVDLIANEVRIATRVVFRRK